MNPNSQTSQAGFATTHWTIVLSARHAGEAPANEALSRLCQIYWAPLYAFLRREGHAPADAADLVQGFFEKLLAREGLRHVARGKGRFRSFLLKSLRHYVANQRRDQRTQRRGGALVHVSLDDETARERCESSLRTGAAPDAVFDRVWAQTMMANATAELRREFEQGGRGPTYRAISRWLAKEPAPGEYARAAQTLGTTEGAIAAAVFRMRQRLRQLIRAQVAHTVAAPDEIEDEMHYLLHVLVSQPGS